MNPRPAVAPAKKPIAPAWGFGGRLDDLADPAAIRIEWPEVAATLAGVPRYNKRHPGLPFSVAQHCVMGADALQVESGSNALAALFLLHDAHEYLMGDITTPALKLISHHLARGRPGRGREVQRLQSAVDDAKATLDLAIYTHARLAAPSVWPEHTRAAVAEMDVRMFEAEATALYGLQIWNNFPRSRLRAPKLDGSLMPPWGLAKAEDAFLSRLRRYAGVPDHQLWNGR